MSELTAISRHIKTLKKLEETSAQLCAVLRLLQRMAEQYPAVFTECITKEDLDRL